MQTRRLHQLRGDANKMDRHDATSAEHLWVVDVGAGQLRLVHGSEALKELVAELALTKTVRVYLLSAVSKVLGEIPELQSAFESRSDASPRTSETEPEAARAEPEALPAGAEDAETARSSQVRDDDFSLLDRPFDDGDSFEEPPRTRWVRAAGLAALVILLGGGGYQLVHSRSATRSPTNEPERESTAVAVAAPAVAEPGVVAPAPAERGLPDPRVTSAEAVQQPVGSLAAPSYSELVAAGQRQFEGGRSAKAQELFEQALAETHDGTAALIGLAYVHLDRGRLQQATGLFQRALDQDRGNPAAMFGLAESHRQQGNRRAALDEFKTFLTLQSAGSDADIARRLVQELANGS
jgi:tetratricopeptide (TPR) repeat protein